MNRFEAMMRRRKFLVHQELQYKLLKSTLWQVSLFAIVATVIIFVPLLAQQWTHRAGSAEAMNAAEQLLFLHLRFWPTLVLAGLFIGLDSLRTSHKIAGPLLVFRRALEELRDGRIPDKQALRKGDLFQRECELINHAIQRVEDRRNAEIAREESLRSSASRLHALLEDPRVSIGLEERSVISDLLDQIEGPDQDKEAAA